MLSYFVCSAVPLAVVSLSGYYAYKFHPDVLLKLFFRYQLFRQNFKVKHVKTKERTFCYAHRDVGKTNGPTLLLLHGFTASKDMWIWMCGFLPKDMEVIALDLPGHGETSTNDEDNLSIEGLADSVHDFVTHAGIDTSKLHLCGQSMGGSIAGAFASKYPDSLSMVTLICPATKTPKLSKFMESVLNGGDVHDWLLPDTEEQVQKMFNVCTYNAKPSSPAILKAVLNLRRPRKPFFERLWRVLFEALQHPEESMEKFKKVSAPCQIIWGEHDDVIDISGIDVIKADNPDVRVEVVDRAGHSVAMERSRKTANLILNFQNEQLGIQEGKKTE